MFNFDPFSRGVAITEIVILLVIAALLGYLLAHLLTNSRISALRAALAEQERALDDCQRKRKLRVSTDEDSLFSKIASRASELNFTRIGYASPKDADDLKEIIGIGPFFERKLHTLGIFSFRQLANFTNEDIEKISDIIEFFPDRIERENWVGQAKQLNETKYDRPVK